MIIDIICPLGLDGIEYAEFLYLTGESLKSGSHKIKWNVVSDKIKETPRGFKNLGQIVEVFTPAMNHARCLILGIEKLKNSNADFVFFVDSDIAFLAKNWDVKLVDAMENHDVVGINRSNKNIKKGTLNRYTSFPLVTFMGFRKQLCQELSWEITPDKYKKKHKTYIAGKRDAKICGVNVGTMLKKDTGWKIPYFFTEKGYTNVLIMDEVIRLNNCKLPYLSKKEKMYCDNKCTRWHMAEYNLENDVFCTHFTGSRHSRFISKLARIWRRRIRQYLDEKYSIII